MSEFCLLFNDITLGYDTHPAVHHLSGKVLTNSLIAVTGANGSGKSTLLKGIAGLIKPMSGSCERKPHTHIAYMPQSYEINTDFPTCTADLVALGLWSEIGLLRRISRKHQERISNALSMVGLSGFESYPINSLSGGQMQRALFARVILQDADLILLDEPFSSVDSLCVVDLMSIVHKWHREGRTIMVVLHDLNLIRLHFPETMILARNLVAWGKTDEIVNSQGFIPIPSFHEAWVDDAQWCDSVSYNSLNQDYESTQNESVSDRRAQ